MASDHTTLVRANDRYATDTPWLRSRHCFSFGPHYDPKNVGFGSLLVSNDDVVAAGTGFDTHPHRDAEIVTWVLSGSLVHQDSVGNTGVIYPGLAQRMSAGSGIMHSEKNDSWRVTGQAAHDEPVHFIQMWLRPDESGIVPSYQQMDIGAELTRGEPIVVASGDPRYHSDAAIHINQRGATLFVVRLQADSVTQLPTARHVHMFVAAGAVQAHGGGQLSAGDSLRIVDSTGMTVRASLTGAELLIWAMA